MNLLVHNKIKIDLNFFTFVIILTFKALTASIVTDEVTDNTQSVGYVLTLLLS